MRSRGARKQFILQRVRERKNEPGEGQDIKVSATSNREKPDGGDVYKRRLGDKEAAGDEEEERSHDEEEDEELQGRERRRRRCNGTMMKMMMMMSRH